jgi:hypothetical protein
MNALRSASGHPVSHVAYSPDGATFAAAQPHSGVTLHDRITGAPIRTAGSNRIAAYRGLVYVNGGARLVASTPKGVEVFDVANDMAAAMHHRIGKDALLGTNGDDLFAAWATWVELVGFSDALPESHDLWRPGNVHIEGFSADGRLVAWVTQTNRLIVSNLFATQIGRVTATAEVSGLKRLPLVQTEGGLRRPPGPERVVFAPRGDRFAVRTGKAVVVFDLPSDDDEPEEEDEDDEKAPPPHGVLHAVCSIPAPEKWPKETAWVPPVAFTPNGRSLLVRRPQQQVQLWDVGSGTKLNQWNWQLEGVSCLVVAPDGLTAVAGGRFGKVVVWDLE